jgi:DNA helicase II / ATP-dependent DNA helicase PcrA
MDLLSSLNPQQKLAVETTEGPVLVIAGAGSGKTRVLTYRIAYIIQQKLASPGEILAVTFTNKAAGEMKERILSLLESSSSSTGHVSKSTIPWCGTFHSMCVKLLKREGSRIGLSQSFSIYDSNDSLSVVKEVMKKLDIDPKQCNPRAVKTYISNAKNELVTSSRYADIAENFFEKNVALIYPEYQRVLRENQALDFDDLIMTTVFLFQNHADVLAKYKQIFKYVHIDEYQDTNHAQYVLIGLLSGKNICAVGDDDQSIYGFRGATVRNILDFEKDFPSAKIIKLEQNYRSTKTIIEASNFVVKQNKERRDKKLWTQNESGEKIVVAKLNDEIEEAEMVAQTCHSLINDKNEDPASIAILYRTNAQSRTFEESFIRHEIPYKIIGSIRFYDRKEVKDIVSYLRILSNPQDDLSLERVINVPRRGIGQKTLEQLATTAKSMGMSGVEFLLTNVDSITNRSIQDFARLVGTLKTKLSGNSLMDFIKFVIEKTGYLDMLNDGTLEGKLRVENLQELLSVSKKYEDQDIRKSLVQFLEDISLIEARSNEENPNSVTLMTVHAAKGLEYKYVFLVGMEENLFPHAQSCFDPEQVEEERRLAYVAITRAKFKLWILHTECRTYFGRLQSNPISRFVNDIPDKLVEKVSTVDEMSKDDFVDFFVEDDHEIEFPSLQVGDLVRHEMFGRGKVVELDDYMVSIDFGTGKGVKELAIEYTRLEKL